MTSSRRFDWPRLAGFGLCTALVVLSVATKASTRVFTWPWVFYAELTMLAPLFLLGWRQVRVAATRHPGQAAFVAAACVLGLSVALSRRPPFSFAATLPLWSGLACTWFLAEIMAEAAAEPKRWMSLARNAGVLLACPLLAALLFWLDDLAEAASAIGWRGVLLHPSIYRNPHPFGHWNYTGGFALLALPWLSALAWVDRGRWRIGWMISSAIGLIVFLSTSSRGAVLGALTMLGLILGFAWIMGRFDRRHALLAAVLGVLAGAALFASNPRLRALVADPSSLLRPNEGDVQRIGMLQGGWLLGWERPWIGHGAGMTPFVYPEVRAQLVGGVETSYQLHNGWLQGWVNTGAAGLVATGWLALVLAAAARRWWRAPASDPRTFGLLSACTLAGYAVFALTDYQLDVIAIVAALGLHAALVLSAPVPETAPVTRRWGGAIVLLAGIASVFILAPEWRARQLFWKAWTPAGTDDITLQRLRAASNASPGNPHYRNHLGFQIAVAAEAKNQPDERRLAREELERSLQLDPAQEPVHTALGWLWLYDNPRTARKHFQKSVRLLPDRESLHLGLALTFLFTGERDHAIEALAMECLLDPRLLASPLWTQDPLAAVRTDVMTRLSARWDDALRHPDLPEWRRPALIYARAFTRWWLNGHPPDRKEQAAAPDLAHRFFTALAENGPSSRAAAWPAPWNTLAAAALQPDQAAQILRSGPAPLPDLVIAGALARLQRPERGLDNLLRQPTPGAIGVSRRTLAREHFMFMHRNLDGPGYADFAPRFQDEFTAYFAGPLFPPRGLLPGPVILHLDQKILTPDPSPARGP